MIADNEAQSRFIAQVTPALTHYVAKCLTLSPLQSEAEDLAMDSIVLFLQKNTLELSANELTCRSIESNEIIFSPEAMLKTYASGLISNALKKKRAFQFPLTPEGHTIDVVDERETPLEHILHKEQLDLFRSCVETLSPELKSVIRQRFFESQSAKTISETEEVSRKTIHVRLARALSSLQKCMTKKWMTNTLTTKPRSIEWVANSDEKNLDWKQGKDSLLENDKFGRIIHLINRNNSNQTFYDQPAWISVPGTVILARNPAGELGLITAFRPIPAPGNRFYHNIHRLSLETHGIQSLEFPRGNADAGETPIECAKREAQEETKRLARDAEVIDWTNQDTALRMISAAVVVVDLSNELVPEAKDDPNESIQAIRFHSVIELMHMVRDGKILCGYTKSALASYIARFPESIGLPRS